jgi:hypothetical protein
MSDISAINKNSSDSTSAFAWGQYRVWAATSREIKATLTAWQLRVLIIFLAGAILGTFSDQISNWSHALSQILGYLSAIALGLAALFSKEILGPTKYQAWIRARSAAEALKSQVYLFLMKAPPYLGNKSDEILVNKVEEINEDVQDMTATTISDDEKRKDLPSDTLSIEDYIEIRVSEQIKKFYNPKAKKHGAIAKCGGSIGLALGIVGVILGIIKGADIEPLANIAGGWIAVVSTATTSVAAYIYAGRHQYLSISYQATARQLEAILAKWRAISKSNASTAERNQFIQDCENTISIENSAWMMAHKKIQ